METDTFTLNNDNICPVLFIPKTCAFLENNYGSSDNIFIDLNITSSDTEGNEACIYSGLCNIKIIDSCDITQNRDSDLSSNGTKKYENMVLDTRNTCTPNSQSPVWIDPIKSPYIYNSSNTAESQEYLIYQQSHSSRITVTQHNTYITQNVYNYKDSNQYSPVSEIDDMKSRKNQNDTNSWPDPMIYQDDELECGAFLSKLSEEIGYEKENQAMEEIKHGGLHNENDALKQLMSSDIQSTSNQHKTILLMEHDSHSDETIQKIAINDSYLKSADTVEIHVHSEDVNDGKKKTRFADKKYQCDKCKQTFNLISEFRQHMMSKHKFPKFRLMATSSEVKYMCQECGKSLKTQAKFETHCLGHGDPDFECNKCHKVFSTKFTLRTHKRLHLRQYPCMHCTKTYSTFEELKAHSTKKHTMFTCHMCNFTATDFSIYREHRKIHPELMGEASDAELNVSVVEGLINENNSTLSMPQYAELKIIEHGDKDFNKEDEIAEANSIITKVVSNKMFLLHTRKSKYKKNVKKTCNVCLKSFDRISDLKRHLIEHIIRSTLAKNPVDRNGTMTLLCEVCQVETFTRLDKYKEHLREHAKLTQYKCTFCDKSFSDSSNFSKHKKIHDTTCFQCDICQRKFNSKKMITQHMEYHNKNAPVTCYYCNKEFHFKSTLSKHIKCTHTREVLCKYRCKFCAKYFKSLREKWDHEWIVHKVRKMKIDCKFCTAKYRKYSELKRHCTSVHKKTISPAKRCSW